MRKDWKVTTKLPEQGCYSNWRMKFPDFSLNILRNILLNIIEKFDIMGIYKNCIN